MLSSFFSKSCDELVIVVRDQSASMHPYNATLNEACKAMEAMYDGKGKQLVHFVAFAGRGQVEDACNISHLSHINGLTCISQGFQRAVEVAKRKHVFTPFSRVCLVFVSDGEDNDMARCMRDLEQLPAMRFPCRMISVGCKGFPTTLASGKLFELFGKLNPLCDPPVLKCDCAEEVHEVFQTLCGLIENPSALPAPTLADVGVLDSVDDLAQLAKRSYNACVMQCLYMKSKPETEAFSECKAILASVRNKLCQCVRGVRVSQAFCRPTVLLSEELRPSSTKNALQLVMKAQASVEALQETVGRCLDMAVRQDLVSARDDAFKLEVAALAGRFTRLATKSLRYHAIDEGKVKSSLVRFLDAYPASAPRDAATVDYESGVSLFDMFSDAQKVLHAVRDPNFTVADIVDKLPQIGVPVTVAELTEGAAMNCWLVQVNAVGQNLATVQHLKRTLAETEETQTQARFDDAMEEVAAYVEVCLDGPVLPVPPKPVNATAAHNCLVPLASEAIGDNATFVKFTASALLYSNQAVFHGEALWSLMAATVTRLLQDLPGNRASATAQLNSIRESFRLVYRDHERFRLYCERMADDELFRECFVAENQNLDRSLTCPHLTKPVFALWIMAYERKPWTCAELDLRYRGFLVEMFHRAKVGLVWAEADYCRPMADVVEGRLMDVLPKDLVAVAPTPAQALAKLKPAILASFRPDSLLPDTLMGKPKLDMVKIGKASHYQFDYAAAKAVFRGLAILSGQDMVFCAEQAQTDLARQLQISMVEDNLERCRAKDFATPIPKSLLRHTGYMHHFKMWQAKAVVKAGEMFLQMYFEAVRHTHAQPAVRLDAEHVAAFSAEALAALDLDCKGLSRTACMCPGCPFFFKPLGPSDRSGKVSSVLKTHLIGVPHVPGLHKALFVSYPQLPEESLEEYVPRVSNLICLGNHLDDTHPDAERILIKIRKAGARNAAATTPLARRLVNYKEYAMLQLKLFSKETGQLEDAVRRVLGTPVLGRVETFQVLSASFKPALG